MCRKITCLYLALVLGMASFASAADVNPYVIGNWESSDSNDSWDICTWDPNGHPVLTPGIATGVTSGSGALMLQQDLTVNGGWGWTLILGVNPAEFMAHDILKIDITRLVCSFAIYRRGYHQCATHS